MADHTGVPVVVVESDTDEDIQPPKSKKKRHRLRACSEQPLLVDLTTSNDSCCYEKLPLKIRNGDSVDSKSSAITKQPSSDRNLQPKDKKVQNGITWTEFAQSADVTIQDETVQDQLEIDLALARKLQWDDYNSVQSLGNDYDLAVELDKELNESDVCILDVQMAFELQKKELKKKAHGKKRESTLTKETRVSEEEGVSVCPASEGTSSGPKSGATTSNTASFLPSKHSHQKGLHQASGHYVQSKLTSVSTVQSSSSAEASTSLLSASSAPVVCDSSSTPEVANPLSTSVAELPSWWVECPKCSVDSKLHKPFHLIDLPMDTTETQQIVSEFIKTNFEIVSIRRIQNASLWRRYQLERMCMLAERGSDTNLNEVLLYHVSRAALPTICGEGLDMRLSRVGNFGKGIYFR